MTMRYSVFDLQVEDIMWFGMDTNGMIFACTSAGCANVPEFVCESREINELLCDFFMNKLERTTTEVLETRGLAKIFFWTFQANSDIV